MAATDARDESFQFNAAVEYPLADPGSTELSERALAGERVRGGFRLDGVEAQVADGLGLGQEFRARGQRVARQDRGGSRIHAEDTFWWALTIPRARVNFASAAASPPALRARMARLDARRSSLSWR